MGKKVSHKFYEYSPGRLMRRRRVEKARKMNKTFIANMSSECRMIIDPDMSISWMYILGHYEKHIQRYLKKVIKPGMTCIDVGANVGFFTILMAKLAGPSGKIISFEPNGKAIRLLEANLQINGLKNVTIEEIALFNRCGFLDFNVGLHQSDAYSSIGEIKHAGAKNSLFISRSVQCSTLDSYFHTNHIERFYVMKIDIEGAELFVLKGMENTLQKNKDAILIIELDDTTTSGLGYCAKDIEQWLIERGWHLCLVKKSGKVSPIAPDHKWTGQMVIASRIR
jgi:FkbM family methyltransferase